MEAYQTRDSSDQTNDFATFSSADQQCSTSFKARTPCHASGQPSAGFSRSQRKEIALEGPQSLSPNAAALLAAIARLDDRHRSTADQQLRLACEQQARQVNVAVLGCAGVGKSTFIRCALDIKNENLSAIACKKVSLEGSISVVRLLEIDLAEIMTNDPPRISKRVSKTDISASVDGVFLLFDVMRLDTFTPIAKTLDSLVANSIPTVLVASKCDRPPKTWKVTPHAVDNVSGRHESVEAFQTALCTPETHKRCVSIMLRNVVLNSEESSQGNGGRMRATTMSQTKSLSTPVTSRDLSGSSHGHVRAASEAMDNKSRESYRRPVRASEPIFSPHFHADLPRITKNVDGSYIDEYCPEELELRDQDPGRNGLAQYRSGSLTARGSTQEDTETPYSDGKPPRKDNLDETTRQGVSLETLVDRLLAMPMSKQDYKFITSFLCLYRRFATPQRLLLEIISRFDVIARTNEPLMCKVILQLRYLGVLQKWTSDYPSDFVHTETRQQLSGFLSSIVGEAPFTVACKEINACLESNVDDEDIEVDLYDGNRSRASTMDSTMTNSSATQRTASNATADSSTEDIIGTSELTKSSSLATSCHSTSASIDSTSEPLSARSTSSSRPIPGSVEDARYQVQFLRPFPRASLDKARWHQLMETPDEHIASELTRIDWILYSAIRPRDLVIHVNLNPEVKERRKSLEFVSAMIDHFNHVALWVTNLILLRDRPKHRALMLEKFIAVAWKLRHYNNYNSLGAIIAGINGTAVHRLSQTRALVDAEAKKQFMRLEILMGTTKSHAAYRLGWQNTSGPRIPFLPLHRRDLVSAEAGNRTFSSREQGDYINWKKFEIMGDVILGIQESQALQYPPMQKKDDVFRLILGCRFCKDEDELYDRSVQLESQGSGDSGRRKFSIFQR